MILITGATGFLGHNMIPQLKEAGYSLRALVRPTSDVSFLQEQGVELAYADDISDIEAVTEACKGCDYVIHAAALFRFWGDLPTFWQTNVGGTAAALEAAARAGVKRFVLISTIAVVGKPLPERLVDEEHPCNPQDFYQRTKLEAEQLALAYHRDRGVPVVVIRPGAFYGPWGNYAFNRLFFEEPLRGWRIKVNQARHITFPVYIEDVAQGVILALTRGRLGEVYNICGQSLDHQTVNTLINDMAGISQWRLNVPTNAVVALAWVWTMLSRFTGREPFYPIDLAPYVFQDWRVSTAKAERELGFKPTSFVKGAQATIDWYREQGLVK
ncbi:MAG TPA: NAD-dependent epimerase/dehydratase family protein [Anaerolineae bacterium]|nr:NAD-dependent epimerase/dehydratase family protein [Anaerolineae bacterium]